FKEVMTPYYIYSDSRFFISSVTLIIISVGGLLQKLGSIHISSTSLRRIFSAPSRDHKKMIVVVLIVGGMLPGYLAIPTGLEVVNYEQRYGWNNLKSIVEQNTGSDSTFVVDRTTEFTWLTSRESAKMPSFGTRSFIRALSILRDHALRYDADYFLVDSYTVTNREGLRPLMFTTLQIGNVLPASIDLLPTSSSQNTTGELMAVQLIGETPANSKGNYARLYTFVEQSFVQTNQVELLDAGWSASNGGSIDNSTGNTRLVIGSGKDYTNSWRPGGFDLGLSVENGYFLMRVGESTATLERISLWTSSGELIGYAEGIGNSYYCAPLGESTVGDIRVIIEGNGTDYLTVESMRIWEAI
ncbi:MAG: hypothetical protein ACOC3C_04405, partial [Candidatus Thorarchaeota archaeon]